jgi:hypothetical protein
MDFLNKLERKLGKYAIPNLSLYLILGYVLGYVLEFVNPNIVYYLLLNPTMILQGQIWRLVTWIIIPPTEFSIFFTVIMLFFYYSVGTSLERTWGTFYYNLYLFMGMIFTVLGSFLLLAMGFSGLEISLYFSSYYINMSIFLAYASTFPDMQVLLMFIIPIKVKWMGIAYAVLLLYNVFVGNMITKIVIGASLLNYVVFFLMTRSTLLMRMSPKQVKRRHAYKKEVKKARPMSIAKHKCAVCGRNSEDNPEAEFRFCSKCNGNYEYCQEHLFTHTHVK